jgi:hypothetical protein
MMEEQGTPSGLDRIESGIPANYELPAPAAGGSGVSSGLAPGPRYGRGTAGGATAGRLGGLMRQETVHEDGGVGGWGAAPSAGGGTRAGDGGGGITGSTITAATARWAHQSAPPEWLMALVSRLSVPWGPARHSSPWSLPPGVTLHAATSGRSGCTLAHTGLGADTGLNRAFLWLAWNQVGFGL